MGIANAYAQSQCSFSRCGDAGLSICRRVRPRSASRHHRVSLIETTLLANSLSLVGRIKCFDALFSPLQFSRSAALHLPQPQRLSPNIQFRRTRGTMEFVGRLNCARRRRNPIARPMIPSHACCWDDQEGRVGSKCEALKLSKSYSLYLIERTSMRYAATSLMGQQAILSRRAAFGRRV